MPQYPTPGVYVEEAGGRAHSIEGVATSTAAFVGPTRRGPVGVAPEPLHSVSDFGFKPKRPAAPVDTAQEAINSMAALRP